MKQEIIDKASAIRESAEQMMKLAQELERMADRAYYNSAQLLKENCDHVYPNGTTAIKTVMSYQTCKICHWNDNPYEK